uniref:HDC08196 n=1 Tax=Drosophila melanogaster TaxID=7227 RepID=Q6ILW5_DROME|nr:TPA_inf: HDC08196 [Drosophila melanogaster]
MPKIHVKKPLAGLVIRNRAHKSKSVFTCSTPLHSLSGYSYMSHIHFYFRKCVTGNGVINSTSVTPSRSQMNHLWWSAFDFVEKLLRGFWPFAFCSFECFSGFWFYFYLRPLNCLLFTYAVCLFAGNFGYDIRTSPD